MQKKRHDSYCWRCSLLWTMQYLHMNSRIKHVHTRKSGNKQPLLCRKISAVKKENFCCAEKISAMQKIFFMQKKFLYAENSFMQKIPLCRKFSFMQKIFFMQKISFTQKIPLCRKFPLCRNFLCRKFSFYAEKFLYAENSSMQKIYFMQKNSYYIEKIILGTNLLQNNAHSWLVLLSHVILIPTIEWPFAQIITTLIVEQVTTK